MSRVDARVVKHLPPIKETPAFELNLHFHGGEGITVILGPSGAGKTLLLNCLGGFVRPDEGRILVSDELYFDAATNVHLPPRLRRCGYIFQDHALFPHMTVRENLRFAASLSSSDAGGLNLRRRVNELLESFDLADLDDRKPAQLSGGQKQRAALARILLTQPRLLLLDEPSRGLDALLRQSFYELLRSLRARLPVPVLLVSHDIDECFELADSVALLDGGRLLQSGARETVFAKPATVEIARLLGIYNIAPAEIRMLDPGANLSRIRLLDQEIEGPYFPGHLIGDGGFLCVRRSEVKAVPPGNHTSKNRLTLRIEGKHASPFGISIALENGFSVVMRETEYSEHSGGDRLTLEIPASAMAFTPK